MRYANIISITSILVFSTSVWAQETPGGKESACVALPVFHCVEFMNKGSAIGHFGYDLQCPADAEPTAEVYIDINDDNMFSPGKIDRGQPKTFISGKHIDEFEVEFTAAEVNAGAVVQWTVLGQTAMVDYSKTKDDDLDCSMLSY